MVVYEKGSIYKGEVTSVESYGAFVKLENGYSGLIHISEISNSFIKNINNIFKKGDSIYVEVLETNDELKQLKLSVKNIKFKLSEKNKVKKSIDVLSKHNTSKAEESLETFSLSGLESYIKERVFGHDDEIKFIAKNILMNYTALDNEKREAMLLLGPTGTGKTETMRAAHNYLEIPFIEVNSANLVPEGIKGPSIEDYLFSLYISANYDLEKASKGIMFFDEFDKLGLSNADYKSSVLQILLKFLDGSEFLIDKNQIDEFNFNTSKLTKVYAGSFTNIFESSKEIGFIESKKEKFTPRRITEADYFGKELISRVPHILVYNNLSREIQKDVIRNSKISAFLLKKERNLRQFNIELMTEESYLDALITKLVEQDRSMRDLNNLILGTLDVAECEMLENIGKYKRLVLTADTVKNNSHFILD